MRARAAASSRASGLLIGYSLLAAVTVEGLVKDFGPDVRAVDHVSFSIPQGDVLTLLGPSGCGKSTILRCVAGLEEPTDGRISIGDETVYDRDAKLDVPVNERGIGMVFQSYAIWPHLNVFNNVAFPLRVQRSLNMKRSQVKSRVLEVLQSVGMAGFEDRYPSELSGGQQQRVVFARCLVYRPDLLLLDEPLANLDAKLREDMRFELREVQQRYGLTTIYVTHDQSEAMALSDNIIVMRAGHAVRQGSPRDVFGDPRHPFVADFLGVSNLFDGRVVSESDGTVIVELAQVNRAVLVRGSARAGEVVSVAIRPKDVVMERPGDAATSDNAFAGTVRRVTYLGEELDCEIAVGEALLRVRTASHDDWRNGDDVVAILPKELLNVLRDEGV